MTDDARLAADIAMHTSWMDRDIALVRDMVAAVQEHWADDSGCPLPRCPSRAIADEIAEADPERIRELLLAALVLLAEQPALDPYPAVRTRGPN